MTDESNPIGADEAREALGSVEDMQLAALRRGVPPRWLGVMVATLFGVMFVEMTSDGPTGAGWLVLVFWVSVLIVRRRAMVTLARNMRMKLSLKVIAAQLSALGLVLAIVTAGRSVEETYGLTWTPLVVGLLIGMVIYALFEFKRYVIRTSIEAEYRV